MAIQDKVERMMKELTFEEKVDVRIFWNITVHFSEFGHKFKQLNDEDVFIWTERYYRIMRKHEFLTFEEPYQFLSREVKRRVLKAGSQLEPRAYLMDKEMEEGGGINGTISSLEA
jgi:hypothetical protein